MAINLPDIDSQSYDEYEQERLRQELEHKQQSFTLQSAIGEKIAGLQFIVGGAAGAVGGAFGGSPTAQPMPQEPAPAPPVEPAPPPPAPEPTPAPVSDVVASQAPPPEPAPAPETTPPPLPSPAAPPVVPGAAPPLGVTPAAPPSPAPPRGQDQSDWIGSALGAVQAAGGDVAKFANSLRTDGDLIGNALGAAHAAGADIAAFASKLPALPTPAAAPSPGAAPLGPGPAPGGDLVDYARTAAQRAGIDPDIFVRQIQQESGFNPGAKSPAGAIGIAQFMPGTAAGMKVDPTDPYAALDAAARMDAQNLNRYGSYDKMLAAYNAGGGAVEKYGGVPPFEETQRYVKNIMSGAGEAVRGAAGAAVQQGGQWLDLAKEQINKPYIWGSGSGAGGRGTGDIDPTTGLPKGFDCSGYVSWVLKNGLGVDLPAQTASAYGKTTAIGADQARPGDVVFYNMDQNDPHQQHMALYIGNGQIIQAGGTSRAVNIDSVGAVGRPEFRRAAGTDAADSRQLVGASVQGAAGMDNQPTPNFELPFRQPESPPLTDIYGRLTPAATGRPDDLYMGGMQAASVGEPTALPATPAPSPAPEQPQSPVDKLKSAFGDFLDSLGGAASNAIASPGGGLPAQAQPMPSDVLTNPLGSGNASQPSALLTGQPAAGIADTGEQGGLDIAGQIGSRALQSAQERIGGIQRLETGNPLIDVPAALPTTAASALGTAVKTGFDVSSELMPSTHLARLEEGTAGEVRRDPAYNAALNRLWDLQDQLYSAGSGAEQDQIRQQMRETQDYLDRRSQEVLQGAGVKDVLSAYQRGMQSPDRETAEAVGALATLPLAGLQGSEIAGARLAGRIADPLAAALPEVLPALRGARAAGAASPRAAVDVAAGALGGYEGWQSDENAPFGERAARAGAGALAAVGAAEAGQYGLRKALTQELPEVARTGSSIVDDTLNMHRSIDTQPAPIQRAVDFAQDALGLGGRTGWLDRMTADRFAAINQITGRARQHLGSAFTPDMDAEAYVATYLGKGGRAQQRLNDDLLPAINLVRDNGDLEYLDAYRKFQRNIEVANLNAATPGVRQASAGVTDAGIAQQGLRDLEAILGPDRWRTLVNADGMINAAQTQLLNDRVAAGLLDPEIAAQLIRDHPHYNPTVVMKHLDEAEGGVSTGGTRLDVSGGNLLRQLANEGSLDATEPPVRSLIRHFVQNDALINRNETAASILRAAMNDPETAGSIRRINPMRRVTGVEVAGPGGPAAGAPGDIASVLQRRFGDMPGTMSVYENGRRVYYEIPPHLEAAVKGLDAQSAGIVEKVLNLANKPLRWGATAASPPFLVTNALADAVTTYLRAGPGTAARIPQGWWAAAKQNELYKEYARAGGLMESLYQRSPQDLDKLVEDTGGLLVKNPGDITRIAKDALGLKWITRAGEVIEQGPRLAAFARAMEEGATPRQAAMAGRRITVDFQRSGEAIRQANMVSLFLNARVQGQLNTMRSLRDDPVGASARLASLGAMNTLAYRHNRDYPEYWDVPKSVRDNNMVWMLPGSEKDPTGPGWKRLNYIAVPMREAATFTAPLNYGLAQIDKEHGQDPRTWQDFTKDVVGNLSPIAGEDAGSAAAMVMPALGRTPIELEANKRFYSGSPIIPAQYQDLPPSQQWNDRTSLLGRKLGDTLGVSPMAFDFIINENLGGLGRTGLGAADQVTNWATRATGGAAPEDQSIPVLGGLLSGVLRTYGGQIARDRYEKLDQLMAQFQEPVADSIRQMPEYQGLTRDAQDQAVRVANQELKSVLQGELGIEKTPRDLGLPEKYVDVTDLREEAKIDNAISKYNQWRADPTRAPEPTDRELELALQYTRLRNPLYTYAQKEVESRNADIRANVDKQLAGARR